MPSDDDRQRWAELHRNGEVARAEMPGSAAELIRAVEDSAQRAGLDLVVRALAEVDDDVAHSALERWADGPVPELAEAAFRHIGGVPLPSWAERILVRFASTPAHPRRYDAMLLLNALSSSRPLFEAALTDPEPHIRSAAYAGLAIHGQLVHLKRLAGGLADPAPEVRDDLVSLWLEVLLGSDEDRRAPLLERAWPPHERPAFEALCAQLRQSFSRLLDVTESETRERVELALRILNPE